MPFVSHAIRRLCIATVAVGCSAGAFAQEKFTDMTTW